MFLFQQTSSARATSTAETNARFSCLVNNPRALVGGEVLVLDIEVDKAVISTCELQARHGRALTRL